MKHVIGIAWFSSRDTIGIVIYRNQIGTYKSTIGMANSQDEEVDMLQIATFGAKFPLKEALSLIKENGSIIDDNAFKSAEQEIQITNELKTKNP